MLSQADAKRTYRTEGLVLGIDLGGTKIFGALANMEGQILNESYLEVNDATGESALDLVIQTIDHLVHVASSLNLPIQALAIGAPGATNAQEGIVQWAPALLWRDFALQSRLQDHFHIPVYVDNDVNLMAYGEYQFGVGKNAHSMVLVAVGTGMGAGIIIEGQILRGANSAAGEIGYMVHDRSALGVAYEGFGAMESVVSGTGIAARAKQVALPYLSVADTNDLDASQVFQAARLGKSWALETIDETIDYLTMTIANLCAVLDPQIIVLGGGVASSADLLVEPIRLRLQGLVPWPPDIKVSKLGSRACALGAVALSINMTHGINSE